MIDYRNSSTRMIQYSHPDQVECWLVKQQENSSYLIAIVTDTNRVIIHKAFTGEWLARLDWSGEQIIVIEQENIMSPYEFRTFKSALSFLDALLLHHFIKTSETRVKTNALAALAAWPILCAIVFSGLLSNYYSS